MQDTGLSRVSSLLTPGTNPRGDARSRDSCMARTCVRWARPPAFAVRRESQPKLVVVRSCSPPVSTQPLGFRAIFARGIVRHVPAPLGKTVFVGFVSRPDSRLVRCVVLPARVVVKSVCAVQHLLPFLKLSQMILCRFQFALQMVAFLCGDGLRQPERNPANLPPVKVRVIGCAAHG